MFGMRVFGFNNVPNRSISGSSGSFTAGDATDTVVTNLNASIYCTGKRISASLAPASSSDSFIGTSRAAADAIYYFDLYQDSAAGFGTETRVVRLVVRARTETGATTAVYSYVPPPVFSPALNPGVGTWYYRVKISRGVSGSTPVGYVENCVLVLEEDP